MHSKGDILRIQDANASLAPEDLVYFYDAIVSGKGEFINRCCLVYTMDPKAMRFLNLLGNRFFAISIGPLIGRSIKDSFCDTKILWRSRYQEMTRGCTYLGELDPFGDFGLLFGADKPNLKIVGIPIRYRLRTLGSTNISRLVNGWLLLCLAAKAAANLFFMPA